MKKLPYVFCFGDELRIHMIPKNAHYAMNKYGMNQGNPIFDHPIPRMDCDEKEEGVYRVMCVRHPLDRIVSAYAFFIKNKNDVWFRRGNLHERYGHNMPFDDFIEVWKDTFMDNIHTIPQIHYAGGQKFDMLFKLEAIDKYWYQLHKRFPDLVKPQIVAIGHQSEHDPWKDYYTPELREELEEILKEDVKLYEEASE